MAGFALVACAVIGLTIETGFTVIDSVLGHPLALGGLASLLLIAGAVLARRGSVLQVSTGVLGVAGLVLIGYAGALVFVIFGFDSDFEDTREVVSPDGMHVAVVREGSAWVDPLYEVRVVTGSGLGQREWLVGCWNADDGPNTVDEVTWESDERLVITTAGGDRYEATIAPGSGKPDLSPRSVC